VSVIAKVTRAHVLLARGRRSEAADPDELVLVAERAQELAAHAPALVAAAAIGLAEGEVEPTRSTSRGYACRRVDPAGRRHRPPASDEPIERPGQVDHDLGHGNPLSSAILGDPIRVRVL
jgi:hypothetical protein